MDKLDELFRLQQKLNSLVGVDVEELSDENRVALMLNYSRGLSQELAELVETMPWKWWTPKQQLDTENAKTELIDILHYVISLAQLLKMKPEDLLQVYKEKNNVNLQRYYSQHTSSTRK